MLCCPSFPSLKEPLNVLRGELFLFSEFITWNSSKPHVPGELRTIKHTKHQSLLCESHRNKEDSSRWGYSCVPCHYYSWLLISFISARKSWEWLFFKNKLIPPLPFSPLFPLPTLPLVLSLNNAGFMRIVRLESWPLTTWELHWKHIEINHKIAPAVFAAWMKITALQVIFLPFYFCGSLTSIYAFILFIFCIYRNCFSTSLFVYKHFSSKLWTFLLQAAKVFEFSYMPPMDVLRHRKKK